MKAMQIVGPGRYEIVETELPVIGDNEVLVEIELVATCPRWDINMMAGRDMFDPGRSPDYPLPPGFPGHEAAGCVRAVGRKVHSFAAGDRVAALEHLPGKGAYAQYLAYPEKDLLKLPASISFRQAVSFELLKCVMLGFTQFDTVLGKSVLVSGLGPAGLLAVQVARAWGASHVTGIDLNENRLEYVRRLGLCEVVKADELGDRRFDLGYDCAGFAPSVQNVLDHTREHVVIFGVQKGDVRFGEASWGTGLRLETYKGRPLSARDKALIIDLVEGKGIDTECLQTHHMSFNEYEKAVEALKTQEAIKVIFRPGQDFGI